ncbi:hypothetical protein I4U23_023158 [Adineta vaga]|nr:hypothetical protein I4U23_023158 [Adineta vaga]
MNRTELEKIKRFQNSYTSEQAIGWYTEECFLYKLLNRAIRTEDTELLYAFRFFIIDLCAALERESKKLQSDNILTVYRGQQIPGEELEKLCHSVGKLISMNGFLSTSRQIDVALQFAPVLRTTRDMQPCIIEIQIDPTLNALMCADISEYSSVKEEDEILFGLNAIFKLDSVQMDSDLRMWKIKLSATTEGLTRIEKYIELQEDEMKECSPLICFGCLLLDEFGQVEQAEKHFNKLLTCLPPDNHSDMSDLYNSMGHVCRHKGDINQALDKYERSYRIRQKFLTPNHPKIARSLYNIGLVYQIKEEYNHALNSFREALAIQNKIYSEDHIEKARTFQSIGLTYQPMGEFDMALAWLNRALDMYTRIHLLSHRDVANCLGHIGALYEKKGDLDRTIDFYHRRLEINEDILPSDHTILPIHLKDLILVYKKKHRLKKTLAFCEMKLASQKAILGDTHHRIASTLMIMGDISKPDKLRRYYEQALTVLQSCKPRNNQIMLVCLERLGEISLSESKSCEGLRYWQQICEIQSEIYQSDHPEIGSCLERLGDIYLNNFDNCRVALRYYRESLVVYQANYVSERQSIDEVQKKIQKVQRKLKE